MLRIEIIGERKREVRIQPAVVGTPAIVALANGNHQPPPRSLKSNAPTILVITTIVKRYIKVPCRGPLSLPIPLDSVTYFRLFARPFTTVSLWCTVDRKRGFRLARPQGSAYGLLYHLRAANEKARGFFRGARDTHCHRQPHRQDLRTPHQARHDSGHGPAPDQG